MKHLISDANSQIQTYQNKFTQSRRDFAFSGSPLCQNGLEHPKRDSAGMSSCYGICHSDVLTGDPRADRLFSPSCTSTRVSVASLRLWLIFTPSCLTPILSRARGRRIEPRHRRRLLGYSRLWRRRRLNAPISSVFMRKRGVFVGWSFVQQVIDLTISYIRVESDEASHI